VPRGLLRVRARSSRGHFAHVNGRIVHNLRRRCPSAAPTRWVCAASLRRQGQDRCFHQTSLDYDRGPSPVTTQSKRPVP
jgi:hypothetical protein